MIWLSACVEYGFGHHEPVVYPVGPQPVLPGEWTEDRWQPTPLGPRDVLLIIDDSGSMVDDLARLQTNVPAIANPIIDSGIDARIAIGTTSCWPLNGDPRCDPLTIVDSGPLLEQALEGAVAIATLGSNSDTEMPWLSIASALNWGRSTWGRKVPLDIIVITDEPDFTPPSVLTVEELDEVILLEDQYRASLLVPATRDPEPRGYGMVSLSAVVPLVYNEDGPCNPMWETSLAGYQAEVNKHAGELHDLCSEVWDPVLDAILVEADITVYLSRRPVVSTIAFHVEQYGVDVVMDPSAWVYDPVANSVSIDLLPAPAWVEYQVAR